MATTVLGNGTITFGDGTSLSSNVIPWSTNVANHPTKLSQYTNNLGNYGGWLLPSQFSGSATLGNTISTVEFAMTWNGTTVGLQAINCYCNCNC